MQLIDGRPVYSATDLVGFLACEHLTQLERAAVARLTQRPDANDPELDVLRARGIEHEHRYLESLRAEGKSIIEVDPDAYPEETQGEKLRLAAAATQDAMARGVDVVYQAPISCCVLIRPIDPAGGARSTTRWRTPSWRATSRQAPCCRSAATSSS
jgi:hypothetical protein